MKITGLSLRIPRWAAIVSVCCSFAIAAVSAQIPVSSDVLSLARKANDYFMAKYADPTLETHVGRTRESNLWTRAVYYEGLMALHAISPEQRYFHYATRWADHHQWTARGGNGTTNADNQCCEQTYIDLVCHAKDLTRGGLLAWKGTLEPTRQNLDAQIATRRYDYWTWIDAIQMAMPIYAKMYAETHDSRYIDYAVKSYQWCRDTCGGGLFNEQEGLWWRDKDYVPPCKEQDGKNCYWSRGNGWVYAALVRCMAELSPKEKAYKLLKRDFLLMSRALLQCQHDDGFWGVSLVSPTTYPGPEMSGTALFLYGMSWGIRQGLLKAKDYQPACERAYQALHSCVHRDGFIGWAQGTGKDPSAGQPLSFYKVPNFEDYGTGCFLLGITEYYRLLISPRSPQWPVPTPEAKPGTRWWWLGSAVDKENLEWNLSEYARAGIGTVEITPLYGVQGNEQHDIPFLSPAWMQALRTTQDIARPLGIQIDMNCGTGWPFGGPQVTPDEAACKAAVSCAATPSQPSPTITITRTGQKVKRAAPGGEGLVMDHFDRDAVRHYLDRFETAFATSGVAYPHTFFNDSYEVYKANWTPRLFDEFQQRRGYDLRQHLPELLGIKDDGNQVLADYRETLSDLLLENFTQQWVAWAHRHGVTVRNQAHGSPANLLDLYAAVDIPEIEGFGLSDFGIKGLRTDSGHTRKNFSDISMLKYASSAAHVTGKPLISSETFTWLTEHFRTSLSQMKPDLDLMFTCGVNRVFFHGSCYTPKDDPWPGWKFYASIDMSPTNSIWRDAPFLMKYIERCQSFLQAGTPDNDFLVYLPVRDMWHVRGPRNDDDKEAAWNRRMGEDLLMQFDIHTMGEKAPIFIRSILKIDSLGYDCDYISDRQLAKVRIMNGQLVTEGGTAYKALIIPSGTTIDQRLIDLLSPLSPYIIKGEDAGAMAQYAKAEPMRTEAGLRTLRRKNDTGYHYFIANLTPNDVETDVPLSVPFQSATFFNPLNGDIKPAHITSDNSFHLALRSGESIILQTYDASPDMKPAKPLKALQQVHGQVTHSPCLSISLPGPWALSFTEESPTVTDTFTLPHPQTWETLSDATAVTMGTGVYTTAFTLSGQEAQRHWQIDLGDVRESARVYINGHFIGCAWAVPFVLDCGSALQEGRNELRIEVTNLPANRIADMDRRGVEWRKFKEINFVDINYKATRYDHWSPMPSGLNGTVRLTTAD